MTYDQTSPVRCANEGCARPAEARERYCAACGLERALFRRDARPGPSDRPSTGGEADRR